MCDTTKPEEIYKKPPYKKGTKVEYDSIKGHTRGSDVYMVYANQKCYPRYLVTFQWMQPSALLDTDLGPEPVSNLSS